MKKDTHPKYMATKVHCNGCDTEFETHSTVDSITVEICSNCHPFYTGKQKLVDVAGRVDRFKAQQEAAKQKSDVKTKKSESKPKPAKVAQDSGKKLQELKQKLAAAPAEKPAQAEQ